jgi:hypothetical protein
LEDNIYHSLRAVAWRAFYKCLVPFFGASETVAGATT